MAERDPTLPQSGDPELQADLVRLLQVQGPLGMLNVLDVVIPTVSMGQVVPLDVDVRPPSFRSTDVFSEGIQINQAINGILADTGALAAGVYDVQLTCHATRASVLSFVGVQHRDAANLLDLARWDYLVMLNSSGPITIGPFSFAYEFGVNERLRVFQGIAGAANEAFLAVIFARRRA